MKKKRFLLLTALTLTLTSCFNVPNYSAKSFDENKELLFHILDDQLKVKKVYQCGVLVTYNDTNFPYFGENFITIGNEGSILNYIVKRDNGETNIIFAPVSENTIYEGYVIIDWPFKHDYLDILIFAKENLDNFDYTSNLELNYLEKCDVLNEIVPDSLFGFCDSRGNLIYEESGELKTTNKLFN